MALAYLTYRGPVQSGLCFQADTGSSRYFKYKIGRRRQRVGGVEILDEVSYESPLLEHLPNKIDHLQSDFLLIVPLSLFSNRASFIQLLSYRDIKGRSPALSAVIQVSEPTIQKVDFHQQLTIIPMEALHKKPFCYQETPVSRAMFWDAILKAAPKIIEVAGPLLGGLLGGKKANTGSVDNEAASGSSDSQQIVEAILKVLGSLSQKQPAQAVSQSYSFCRHETDHYAGSMAINPAMLAQLAPVIEKVVSPEMINAIGDQPVKLLKAISDGMLKMNQAELRHLERLNPGVDDPTILPILNSISLSRPAIYSYAHIAPALLAALPALASVAEKVLDPKTIEALGNQPVKLFKAINDGLLAGEKQEMEHLERLNPGVEDNTIMPLLNSMSLTSGRSQEMRFQYSHDYELQFREVKIQRLSGREKVLYHQQHDLVFPLRLVLSEDKNQQRVLPKAIIELKVTDAGVDHVFMYKRIRIRDLAVGETFYDAMITAQEASGFPLHRDLKLDVSVIWPGRSQRPPFGVFKSHLFCLSSRYFFLSVGTGQGGAKPLNDPAQHRIFWHKIWEGGYTESKRWELDFDLKYYYAYNRNEQRGAHLETRRQITIDNATPQEPTPYRRKVTARLKSGMELTPLMLNELLRQMGQPTLTFAQLQALDHPKVADNFNQSARKHVEFRGKSGQSAALWVYPEVQLFQFHLAKVQSVDRFGQVEQLGEESVLFPRPTAIHFIGTISS